MNIVLLALLLVHLAAAIAAAAHVLFYYRRPAAAVSWLITLFLLPLIGSLLYLMLAVYGGPRSVRRRRKEAKELRGRRGDGGADPGDSYPENLVKSGFSGLMQMACSLPLRAGNDVRLIADDSEALDRQLATIRDAEREIFLQTYVLKPGGVLDALVDALAGRARAGVSIRFLIDPIGAQELPGRRLREIREHGIDVRTFLRPNPWKGRLQVNFRNHRKLLMVDGRVAFTGGRNWADEYYSRFSGDQAFRDTTVVVRGPVLGGLHRVVLEDWAIATEDESVLGQHGELRFDVAGDVLARAVPGGPDEPRDDPRDVFGGAFRAARRSILIATPYFVPGPVLHRALRVAAMSGIEVDLLMPRRCESRAVDLAGRYYFDGLLDAGVRIWLREAPMLHAKAVVVDDEWTSIGSVNFDHRSFHLNYELNLEVLGADFARSVRDFLAPDFERSQRVDPEEFPRRGIRRRVLEKAAALFEPLM